MKNTKHFVFEPSNKEEAVLAGKIGLILATTSTYTTQLSAILDNYELLINYLESLNPVLIERAREEARTIAKIIDKCVGEYLYKKDYDPSKEIGLLIAISSLFFEISATISKKIANSCIEELKKMGAIEDIDIGRD